MKKTLRQSILRAYVESRSAYETFAREVLRLLDANIDPSVPTDSIYTIKYRLKGEDRLIEKLETLEAANQLITQGNYAEFITDILGIRIICLRLADVDKLSQHLNSLRKEKKLKFIKGPVMKKTFVLPVNPGDGLPSDIDLQYSGYSSIHYIVKLGSALKHPKHLAPLVAEIQVRTILEEAWGEIDHKYRYEIVRKENNMLPDSIARGFYSFSAYLQAAALHAEHLCRDAESFRESKQRSTSKVRTQKKTTDSKKKDEVESPPRSGSSFLEKITTARRIASIAQGDAERFSDPIDQVLYEKCGIVPTERLSSYVKKRLRDYGIYLGREIDLRDRVLSQEVIDEFAQRYFQASMRTPFKLSDGREIDVINLVNYGLARLQEPVGLANAKLEQILRKRFAS